MTTRTDERQMDLLALLEQLGRETPAREPGSMNVDVVLRGALSEAIRQFRGDRYEVASGMSRVLGIEVTKSQLDAWTAESKEHSHRFPAAYLPAFCQVVGSWRPLAILAEVGGKRVHSDPDVDIAAQMAQLEVDIHREEQGLARKRALLKQARSTWVDRRAGGKS